MKKDLAYWNTMFGNLHSLAAHFTDNTLYLYCEYGNVIISANGNKLIYNYIEHEEDAEEN